MMRRTSVESEAMRSVGFHEGTLEIEFIQGDVYRYFDVPSEVYEALMRAESHGAFLSNSIRDRFRFARL